MTANKNLTRDTQVLIYILKNIQKIQNAIKYFNCDLSTNTQRSLLNNEYAFDLCSMYMAQIGENVKLLTESSKRELSKVVDFRVLRYFRNMIDHNYEKVNRLMLQSYISLMIPRPVVTALRNRLVYCQNNKQSK